MELPAEITKQIVLEFVSEDAIALKGASGRCQPSRV
jgi:hypothetical protein